MALNVKRMLHTAGRDKKRLHKKDDMEVLTMGRVPQAKKGKEFQAEKTTHEMAGKKRDKLGMFGEL